MTVTRTVLLLRLIPLPLVLLSPTTTALVSAFGIIVVGLTALFLLRSRRGREFVTRHPLAAVVDVAILLLVVGVSGTEFPFLVALLSSALLIGLWTRLAAGAVITASLIVAYLTVWPSADRSLTDTLIFPLIFAVLWWLGLAIQIADASERRSQEALQQAVAMATASQERSRLAREMHDTLAKSLQAIQLTATALPTLVERDPPSASRQSREIQKLSAAAIDEARDLMSHLRRPTPDGDLPELVNQICDEWERTNDLPLTRELDGTVEVTDELVRYELGMALSEALENIQRHAQAKSVQVHLWETDHQVTLEITDDGTGIPRGRLSEALTQGRFGMRGMTERMATVGGQFTVAAAEPHGTRVTLSAPRHGLVETSSRALEKGDAA